MPRIASEGGKEDVHLWGIYYIGKLICDQLSRFLLYSKIKKKIIEYTELLKNSSWHLFCNRSELPYSLILFYLYQLYDLNLL